MQRTIGSMLKVVDGAGESDPVETAPRFDALAALARRAAVGEGTAMRDLLRSVAPGVLGAVRAVSGSGAHDVDDITQEALVAFVHALPAFRAESSVQHYASRIAVRVAIAARKRRMIRERHAVAVETESLPDEEAAPDDPWDTRRRALLRSLLDELPEIQAETLALRVALGYSMQEVADATSAPVNTVRSRLRLAKEALRRRIERDPSLCELLGGEP
jgi:RNA polymerase sigma factor (sigma-70 family)